MMMSLKEKLKKPAWVAGFAAIIIGILTHMFGLVNVLHNHDDLVVQPTGFGTSLLLGRWFLEILGVLVEWLFGGYNLPWVNGILFLILLSVSAGFLVAVLQLKNLKTAALIGALFIVYPTVTSTMLYRYTVIYYGIGILLSILAAWILEYKTNHAFLLSSLCTTLSLAIYQAYTPITVSIFVLLLIKRTINKEIRIQELVQHGLYDCASILLGLMVYFLVTHLSLSISGLSLSSYQGVDRMGQLTLSQFPMIARSFIVSYAKLLLIDFCGLTQTNLLKLCYLLLGLLSIGMVIYIVRVKFRKRSTLAIALSLSMLFLISVDFIVVMCPPSSVHTMTVYAFVLLPCAPFVLLESLPLAETPRCRRVNTFLSKTTAIAVALVIASYAYWANVNYTCLYYSNRQAENYMNSILVQVRMTEGFDTKKKWAIIGNIEDPLIGNEWQDVPVYRGNFNMKELINEYSRKKWFSVRSGYYIPFVNSADINKLSRSEKVKAMPSWPDQGSIQVIDDVIVIKFQDLP